MKIPDIALELSFCVVYKQKNQKNHKKDKIVVDVYSDPESLHKAFDNLPKDTPAYGLNFGMIIREQNI